MIKIINLLLENNIKEIIQDIISIIISNIISIIISIIIPNIISNIISIIIPNHYLNYYFDHLFIIFNYISEMFYIDSFLSYIIFLKKYDKDNRKESDKSSFFLLY